MTADGEVAGHAALVMHGDNAPELGMVATKRKFRGLGAASKLVGFLNAACLESGYDSAIISSVCVHPFTQKVARKSGFIPCGFLLGDTPKSWTFKGISEDRDQRVSEVIGFKQLRRPASVPICPPERHRDMIESIYRRLDRPAVLAPAGRRRPSGATRLEVDMSSALSMAGLVLRRCGADVVDQILDAVRQARREEMRVIELFLDLSDPGLPWTVAKLEERRFFFTGVMPGTKWGDALIMQRMEGVQIDYDSIVTVEDPTTELLDYIRRLDVD